MIDEAHREQLNRHRRYVCPADAGPAWRTACEYGSDMSLVEDALKKTPEERLEAHQRVLDMLLELNIGLSPKAQNNRSMLTRLKEHEVHFVIIGGLCGVLHGLSLVTFDLEVCCPFSLENLQRLQDALSDLHLSDRLGTNKFPLEIIGDVPSRLCLQTDLGRLDCVSEVAGLGDYEAVLKNSAPQDTGCGDFRMLHIDALIVAKEAAGLEPDLVAVRLLRAIKEKKGPNKI
jgi:hypothetical protein